MSSNINLLITPDTKVGEMLDAFPFLEEKLIAIAPVFTKLRNPVLRKTIAKVTSLRQAATVGQVPVSRLINELRMAAGQPADDSSSGMESWKPASEYSDENVTPVEVYDAREDLENGVHPGAKVAAAVSKLDPGQVYLLITPFVPAPLIDKMTDKGNKVWTKQTSSDRFETYIRKA